MALKHYLGRAALTAALLLVLAIMPSLALADGSKLWLEVVDRQGKTLIALPVQHRDRWCLLWNHSVAGFTVSDCFVIKHTELWLKSSHQPDFAAGLGHLEGRGIMKSDGRGGYRIEQINEPVPNNTLILRVGSAAVDHRLRIRDKEISLSDIAARQRVMLRLTQR